MASDGELVCGSRAVAEMIGRIADGIISEFGKKGLRDLVIIGIQRRGVPFAKKIASAIEKKSGIKIRLGTIDISMYRDDIGMRKSLPVIRETSIPFNIDGNPVILTDDVLQAGRTIRAALDAITGFGRPSVTRLAILVDRDMREFPIAADYIGMKLHTAENRNVLVTFGKSDRIEIVAKKKN